jgi:hypothetical protein
MEKSPPIVRVVVALTGDTLDFAALEKAGLPEPHLKSRRGELRATGWPPSPETIWAYERQQAADSLETPIKLLLDDLDPYIKAICELGRNDGAACKLLVTVTIKNERPVYELSAHTIARLSSLGADLSLDIFDYSE